MEYLDQAAQDASALHRARSWFLLERGSTCLGESPLAAWSVQEELLPGDAWTRLLESVSSCFEVGEDPSEVHDLWSGRRLNLHPSLDPAQAQDLWIGRFYPSEEGSWLPLPGAHFLVGPDWLPHLRNDLAELRASQSGKRLSLMALESLCTSLSPLPFETVAPASFPTEVIQQLVADEPEWDTARVQEILESQGLAGLMDTLAFATHVDLEALRLALAPFLSASNSSSVAPAEQSTAAATPSVLQADAALEQFERARSRGDDLSVAFQQLETSLGLQRGSSEDPELNSDGPIGPERAVGLSAWLETWLWERQQAGTSPSPKSVEAVHGFCQALEREREPADAADLNTAEVAATAYIVFPSSDEADLPILGEFLDWCKTEQGAELDLPTEGSEWGAWCHRIRSLAAWHCGDEPPVSWHTTTLLDSGKLTAEGQTWVLGKQNPSIQAVLQPGDLALGEPSTDNPEEFRPFRWIPRECHRPDSKALDS